MVRQGHLIVLVVAFLMGCTVLLMAGASGVLAQASQHNKQKLSGTNGRDTLRGGDSDDTIRGLGGNDNIQHGSGDDVVYGGGGDDDVFPDSGKDVIYGGDGNDKLDSGDDGGDKLYCGAGRDKYIADKNDYVDSSCEKNAAAGPHQSGIYTGVRRYRRNVFGLGQPHSGSARRNWRSCHPSAGGRAAARVGHPDLRDP